MSPRGRFSLKSDRNPAVWPLDPTAKSARPPPLAPIQPVVSSAGSLIMIDRSGSLIFQFGYYYLQSSMLAP